MARPSNRLCRLVLESHDGRALGADSEEKHEPASDIDTVAVDSLKVLDPEWPIRKADIVREAKYVRANLCRSFPVEHFLRQNEIWGREAFREAIVNGPDEIMSSLDFAASHPDSRELQSGSQFKRKRRLLPCQGHRLLKTLFSKLNVGHGPRC